MHPKLLPPQGDRTESSQYEGHSRGSPSRSWQRRGNLSIPRGRPPTTDPSPTLSDPQGDAWKGQGVEKKSQALLNARILRNHNTLPSAPSFLSCRRIHRRPLPLTAFLWGLLLAPLFFPSHGHLHPPHHVFTIRTVSTTKGEARCGLRTMEGQGSRDKAEHGMGCGPWCERPACGEGGRSPKGEQGMNSLLLGFLLLGTPMARVGSYRISLLCLPQELEATPQCPPIGIGRPQGFLASSTRPTPGPLSLPELQREHFLARHYLWAGQGPAWPLPLRPSLHSMA